MWKNIPVLLCCLFVGGLTAQTTLTTDYFPEIGDSLHFSTADSASLATVVLGNVGGPQNWDLTGLVAARSSTQPFVAIEPGTQDDDFPTAELKLITTDLTTNYYRVTDGEFILVGNIGASELLEDFIVSTPFSPGYVERRAPLNFIDQFSLTSNINVSLPTSELPQEILDALGPIADGIDSMRFRTMIDRTDLVDAYGTADIGDDTYDVLRERREEIRSITVEAYSFIFGWSDVTAAIALALPGVGDLLASEDTIITYTLWSNATIDPIAIIETENDGQTVTGVTYKTVETTSSVEDNFLSGTQVKMFPNPTRNLATFQAFGLNNGEYELRIHSVIGRKMLSRKIQAISGELRSEIDVTQFPSGLYLYSLVNARGRIMATKRLFVGGNR